MSEELNKSIEESRVPNPAPGIPQDQFVFESIAELEMPPELAVFDESVDPEYQAMLNEHADMVNRFAMPATSNYNNPDPGQATGLFNPYQQGQAPDLSTAEGKMRALHSLGNLPVDKAKGNDIFSDPTANIADPIAVGIRESSFDRYYAHPKFAELGWHPYADNETYYNENSSWWDDAGRMWGEVGTLATTGFASVYRSWFSDDVMDLKSAVEFEDAMRVGNSSKGGFGGFMNNMILQSGYTFGIIGSIALEEAIMWGATALSGGVLGGAAAVKTAANVSKLSKLAKLGRRISDSFGVGKMANASRRIVDGLKNSERARDFWQGVKNGDNILGKLLFPETMGAFKQLKTAQKAGENLTQFAKYSKAFGGFYRDIRSAHMALGEGRMEAGGVFKEHMQNEYSIQVAKNLKEGLGDVTTEQMIAINERARQAAFSTTMFNAPAIYLSNQLLLGNSFGGFKRSLSRVMRDTIEGLPKRILKTKATVQGGKIAKDVFEDVGESFMNLKYLYKSVRAGGLKGGAMMGAGAALRFFSANVSEGIQETYQEAVSAGVKDYFKEIAFDPSAGGLALAKASALHGLSEQFSGQGFETFMSGFLMGGVVSGPQKAVFEGIPALYQMTFNKEAYDDHKKNVDKLVENAVNVLNETWNAQASDVTSMFDESSLNFITQKQAASQLQIAMDNNEIMDHIDVKDEARFAHLVHIFNNGSQDLFREQLEDFLTLSDEELAEAFPSEKVRAKNGKLRESITKQLANIDQMEETYRDNKDKNVNPFDPTQFEPNSREWVDETLKHRAFEHARMLTLFTKDGFIRAGERAASIYEELASDPIIKDIAANDITVLLNQKTLLKEIEMLEKEIPGLGEAGTKLLKKQKEKKLLALQAIADVLYADENQTLSAKDKRFDRRKTSKLMPKVLAYLKLVAETKDDFVDEGRIKDVVNKIVDHNHLSNRQRVYDKSLAILANPERLDYIVRRGYEYLKYAHENKLEILEKAIRAFINKKEINQVLNELLKLRIYVDLDQAIAFGRTGNADDLKTFLSDQGIVNESTDPELYAKIMRIIDVYKQTSQAKVQEEKRKLKEGDEEATQKEAADSVDEALEEAGIEGPEALVYGASASESPVLQEVLKDLYKKNRAMSIKAGIKPLTFQKFVETAVAKNHIKAYQALKKLWYQTLSNIQEQDVKDNIFSTDKGFADWLSLQEGNLLVSKILGDTNTTFQTFIPEFQRERTDVAEETVVSPGDKTKVIEIVVKDPTTGETTTFYQVVYNDGTPIQQELVEIAGLDVGLAFSDKAKAKAAQKKLDNIVPQDGVFSFDGFDLSFGTEVVDSTTGKKYIVIGTPKEVNAGGRLYLLPIGKVSLMKGTKKNRNAAAIKLNPGEFKARYKVSEVSLEKLNVPSDVSKLRVDEATALVYHVNDKFDKTKRENEVLAQRRFQAIIASLNAEELAALEVEVVKAQNGGTLTGQDFKFEDKAPNSRIKRATQTYSIALKIPKELQGKINSILQKANLNLPKNNIVGYFPNTDVALFDNNGSQIDPLNITANQVKDLFSIFTDAETAAGNVRKNFAIQYKMMDTISSLLGKKESGKFTLKQLGVDLSTTAGRMDFLPTGQTIGIDQLSINEVDGHTVIVENRRNSKGKVASRFITSMTGGSPKERVEFPERIKKEMAEQNSVMMDGIANAGRYVMIVKSKNGTYSYFPVKSDVVSKELLEDIADRLIKRSALSQKENIKEVKGRKAGVIANTNYNSEFNAEINDLNFFIATNIPGYTVDVNLTANGSIQLKIYDREGKSAVSVYMDDLASIQEYENLDDKTQIFKDLFDKANTELKEWSKSVTKNTPDARKDLLKAASKLKFDIGSIREGFSVTASANEIASKVVATVQPNVRGDVKLISNIDGIDLQQIQSVLPLASAISSSTSNPADIETGKHTVVKTEGGWKILTPSGKDLDGAIYTRKDLALAEAEKIDQAINQDSSSEQDPNSNDINLLSEEEFTRLKNNDFANLTKGQKEFIANKMVADPSGKSLTNKELQVLQNPAVSGQINILVAKLKAPLSDNTKVEPVLTNPKVVISGTADGYQTLSSSNTTEEENKSVQDARGDKTFGKDGFRITKLEDGSSQVSYKSKVKVSDKANRPGFAMATVIIPKGIPVNKSAIQQAFDAELTSIIQANRNAKKGSRLSDLTSAQNSQLANAVVQAVSAKQGSAPSNKSITQQLDRTQLSERLVQIENEKKAIKAEVLKRGLPLSQIEAETKKDPRWKKLNKEENEIRDKLSANKVVAENLSERDVNDIDEFIAWANENLPDFITTEDIATLGNNMKSGGERVGAFVMAIKNIAGKMKVNGTIYTGTSSKYGYHEAFHAVFRMLLTPEQQATYISAAKKEKRAKLRAQGVSLASELQRLKNSDIEKYKNLSNEQLEKLYYEEYMADEFQLFKENPKKTKTTSWIKSLFNKIMEFIKSILGTYNATELRLLYEGIDSGKFKTASVAANSFTQEVNMGITVSANKILRTEKVVLPSGKIEYKYLDGKIGRGLTSQITARVIDQQQKTTDPDFDIVAEINKTINAYRKLYNIDNPQYQTIQDVSVYENLVALNNALDNYGKDLVDAVVEELSFYDVGLETTEEEDGTLENSFGLRTTSEWDKDASMTGGFRSLSAFLRKYIGTTTLIDEKMKTDPLTGQLIVEQRPDMFGNFELDIEDAEGNMSKEKIVIPVDFSVVYSGFLKAISGISDPVQILQRLYLFSRNNPQTRAVQERLFNDLGIVWEGQLKDGILPGTLKRNDLFQAVIKGFENFRVDYLFIHRRTKDGQIISYNAALRDDANTQIEIWDSAYRNLRKKFKDNPGLIEDAVKQVQILAEALNKEKPMSELSDEDMRTLSLAISQAFKESLGLRISEGLIEFSIAANVTNKTERQKSLAIQYPNVKAIDYKHVMYMVDALELNDNLMEDDEGVYGRLREIAIANANFDETVGASVFKNPAGDLVYAHQLPTFHLKQIAKLNDVSGGGEVLDKIYKDLDLNYNYLLGSPAFRALSAEGRLRIQRIAGVKSSKNIRQDDSGGIVEGYDKSEQGITYGDLTQKEFLMALLGSYTANMNNSTGEIETVFDGKNNVALTPSLIRVIEASNTGDMVSLPVIKAIMDGADGGMELTPEVVQYFIDRIEAETERILDESGLDSKYNPETQEGTLIAGYNATKNGQAYDKNGRAFKYSNTGNILDPIQIKAYEEAGVGQFLIETVGTDRLRSESQSMFLGSQKMHEKSQHTIPQTTKDMVLYGAEKKESKKGRKKYKYLAKAEADQGTLHKVKYVGFVEMTNSNESEILNKLGDAISDDKTETHTVKWVQPKDGTKSDEERTKWVESEDMKLFLQGKRKKHLYEIVRDDITELSQEELDVAEKAAVDKEDYENAARIVREGKQRGGLKKRMEDAIAKLSREEASNTSFDDILESIGETRQSLTSFVTRRLMDEFAAFQNDLEALFGDNELPKFIMDGVVRPEDATRDAGKFATTADKLNLRAKNKTWNLAQIFFSNWVNTSSLNEILLGDQALTLKDAVDAVKRAKMQNAAYYSAASSIAAPEFGIDKPVQEMSIFPMTEPTGKSRFGETEEAKKDIDEADAQLWMTVKAFKHMWFGFGKLTAAQNKLLDRIANGEKIPTKEIFGKLGAAKTQAMINSKKLVYGDGKTFIKMSAFTLTKQYTSYQDAQGNWIARPDRVKLHNMRERMERFEQENDTIALAAPISAMKMLKENVNNINTFVDTQNVNTPLSKSESMTLDANFMGLQVINPSNKLEITDPTQIKTLITGEQNDATKVSIPDGEGGWVEKTIGDLRYSYNKAIADRLKGKYLDKRNLVFTFDVEYAMNEVHKSIDQKKITADLLAYLQYAQTSLMASQSASELVEFFGFDPDTGEAKYELNNPLTIEKFEQLFLSYFNKSVISEKLPGISAALVSDYGVNVYRRVLSVDENGYPDRQEIIRSDDFLNNYSVDDLVKRNGEAVDFSDDQSFETLKTEVDKSKGKGVIILDRLRFDMKQYDEKGNYTGVKYSESMLPAHTSDVYTNLDLKSGEAIPDSVSKMFGIRIPSQDNHSTINIKVVDFLPVYYGSSIISPRELVEVSGADFDIDKLYIQMKEYYSERVPTGKKEKIYDVVVDMYEHTEIKDQTKAKEPLDVWVVDSLEQAQRQLDLIKEDGGGENFGEIEKSLMKTENGDAYYFIPHKRGDNKRIYIKGTEPKALLVKDKLRTKGKPYMKEEMKTQFKEYGDNFNDYQRYIKKNISDKGSVYKEAANKAKIQGVKNPLTDAEIEKLIDSGWTRQTIDALLTLGLPLTEKQYNSYVVANKGRQPYSAGLNNEVLDLKWAMMSNEHNTSYKDGQMPISYESADIDVLTELWDEMIEELPELADAVNEDGIDPDNLLGQGRGFGNNKEGAASIGAVVRPNLFLSLLQEYNIKLKSRNIKGEEVGLRLTFGGQVYAGFNEFSGTNNKVIISGTGDGYQVVSSANTTQAENESVKDARGDKTFDKDGFRITKLEDGSSQVSYKSKVNVIDKGGRPGYAMATVIIPKGTGVNKQQIQEAFDNKLSEIIESNREKKLGAKLSNLTPKQNQQLADAVVKAGSAKQGREILEDGSPGKRKQYIISALITAMTDNAKERLAAKLGLAKNALGIVATMTAMGVPIKTSIYLINNPTIKRSYFLEKTDPEFSGTKKFIESQMTLLYGVIKDLGGDRGVSMVGTTDVNQEVLKELIKDPILKFNDATDLIRERKSAAEEGNEAITLEEAVMQYDALAQFLNALDISGFTKEMGALMDLTSGYGQNIASMDETAMSIDKLGLNIPDAEWKNMRWEDLPLMDVRPIFRSNTWQSTSLSIFEEFYNELLPEVFLSRSKGGYNKFMPTLLYNSNFYDAKNKVMRYIDPDVRKSITRDILSIVTIKSYMHHLSLTDPQAGATLTNDIIYPSDNKNINIVAIVEKARELQNGKFNFFLDDFIRLEDALAEGNKTGTYIAGSNTLTRIKDSDKVDLQNGFKELFLDPKTRYLAMDIMNYLMVKDGLQPAYKTLLSAISPPALGKYLENASTIKEAFKRGDGAFFESVMGMTYEDFFEELVTNYFLSAKTSYMLSTHNGIPLYNPKANTIVANKSFTQTQVGSRPNDMFIIFDNEAGVGSSDSKIVRDQPNAFRLIIKKGDANIESNYYSPFEVDQAKKALREQVKAIASQRGMFNSVFLPSSIPAEVIKGLQDNSPELYDELVTLMDEYFDYNIAGYKTKEEKKEDVLNTNALKAPINISMEGNKGVLTIDLLKGVYSRSTTFEGSMKTSSVKTLKGKQREAFEKNKNLVSSKGFGITKVETDGYVQNEVIFPAAIRTKVGDNWKYFKLKRVIGSKKRQNMHDLYTGPLVSGSYAQYVEVDVKGSTAQFAGGYIFGDLKSNKEVRKIIRDANPIEESDMSKQNKRAAAEARAAVSSLYVPGENPKLDAELKAKYDEINQTLGFREGPKGTFEYFLTTPGAITIMNKYDSIKSKQNAENLKDNPETEIGFDGNNVTLNGKKQTDIKNVDLPADGEVEGEFVLPGSEDTDSQSSSMELPEDGEVEGELDLNAPIQKDESKFKVSMDEQVAEFWESLSIPQKRTLRTFDISSLADLQKEAKRANAYTSFEQFKEEINKCFNS